MNYLRQIIFEMRNHPLMTALSIIGTALAIFLIMSDYMISSIDTINVAPESRRSRIAYGYGGDANFQNRTTCSGSLSYELAHELYSGLDGVETVSYSSADPENKNIAVKGGVPENRLVRSVDENYWGIYDYTFEEGRPFSKEEVEAAIKYAVIARSTAEKLFGKQPSYLGREINIDNHTCTVIGVISDVNPLMTQSYADVFIPHTVEGLQNQNWMTYLGSYTAILLLKDGTDIRKVKKQVEHRYNIFNDRHKEEDVTLTYHDQPWDNEQRSAGGGSNITPDLTYTHRLRLAGYALLLIIPAINLSSMTRSRMRRKVSEIGLRRAFGCTRSRIVADMLIENSIITLIGGIIGVFLSYLFILGFSNYFISYGGTWFNVPVEITMARPTFRMLFSWRSLLMLLLFCLLLNLLSAGIPALRAAYINPAEAITGHNNHK